MSAESTVELTEPERTRIIVGVLTALFLAAIEQTIVSPALPTIGAALGGGIWLNWVVSVYFLTATAVAPLAGKIADLKGRVPVLYTAIGLFMVGSVVSATADSMAMLILGRACQGIGGGSLVAAVQTIIGDVAPPKIRVKYTVYITALWGVASVTGPLLGGILAQYMHWSMIFWINLPIGCLALVICWRALKKIPVIKRPHALDILGAVLIIFATVTFLLALTLGGKAYTWGSLQVLGLGALSALATATFVWRQFRAPEPLLPPRVLAEPVIRNACFAAFLSSGCMIGTTIFYPLYLELVKGLSPSQSGAALVALIIGAVVGSNEAGRFMRRAANYKRISVFGACLTFVALMVLSMFGASMSISLNEICIFAVGFGLGNLFPVAMVSVQNAADPRDLGVSTATYGFLRSLGSAIGIAILGAIGAASGVGVHKSASGDEGEAAKHLLATGFSHVFAAAALTQILVFLLLIRMEQRPLRETQSAITETEGA